MSNPDAFFEAHARATQYDEAMRERFEREADEWCKQRAKRHAESRYYVKQLQRGWREASWVTERASEATGFKKVRVVRVRVTEPGSNVEAEGEYEEWIGDDGSPRRRSLKLLPPKFDLARKMFGDTPFISISEQRRAVDLFGSWALAVKAATGLVS